MELLFLLAIIFFGVYGYLAGFKHGYKKGCKKSYDKAKLEFIWSGVIEGTIAHISKELTEERTR